jgi:segregation and condensation protein B
MQDIVVQDNLSWYIEALIFATDTAISTEDIRSAMNNSFDQDFELDFIQDQIDGIVEKYLKDEYVTQLMPIAGGYQFLTKPIYHKVIGDYLRQTEKKRLSRSAMETLSIVAYKQPLTKTMVESIRGVNCDYALQKLLEKELVEIKGREDGPGRPLLYGTTIKFLDHFGIKDMKELPNLKDLETVENSIGEK